MKKEYPSVLLICCTHGNEGLGKVVIDKINRIYSNNIKGIVANWAAYMINKKYLDIDLNRVFPGRRKGNHEEKLAYELNKIIQQYDYVLDVHIHTAPMEKFVIVKRKNKKTREILDLLQFKHIMYMKKGMADGCLINYCNGVALEYPHTTSPKEIEKDVKAVIEQRPNKKVKRKEYLIYDVIKPEEINLRKINYVPVLVGTKSYNKSIGLKAKLL